MPAFFCIGKGIYRPRRRSGTTSGLRRREVSLPSAGAYLSGVRRIRKRSSATNAVGGTAVVIFAQDRGFALTPIYVSARIRASGSTKCGLSRGSGRVVNGARAKTGTDIGNLDGIETGVRKPIREQPLETQEVYCRWPALGGPKPRRNRCVSRQRQFLSVMRPVTTWTLPRFRTLRAGSGEGRASSLWDELYPQPSNESALQQLEVQLANRCRRSGADIL